MSNSQQPQCTAPFRASAVTTRSPTIQPEVSSQLGMPPRSVRHTQHTGTQNPAVVHINPLQSRYVEHQDNRSPTPQQKAVQGPLQHGHQRTNSQQSPPSRASAVVTTNPAIQPVSLEYDFHFPVSSYIICSVQICYSHNIITHIFQTLHAAAKAPKQRKQQTSAIPNSIFEQHSPLLRSQFSHHLHDYKAEGNTEHNHRPEDVKLLESELTRDNYREKFHQLLCREEEEHERLLAQR